MVVESPDNHVMLGDECQLGSEDGIFVLFWQHIELIEVIVEGWLVGDDEVLAGGGSALEHVHCGHHRYSDPGDGFIWIARLERVHRFRLPRHADMVLYPADDFAGGEMLLLAQSQRAK